MTGRDDTLRAGATSSSRRRVLRVLSVLSPAILFIGCDLIGQAFELGYDGGYGFVDFVYGCAASCEQQRQQRNAEIEVWNGACGNDVLAAFPDQASLDAAQATCQEQYSFNSGIVFCDDVGQAFGTEPPGCGPFDEPVLGAAPGRENYACPNGAAGLCLCCDDNDTGQRCTLAGGFCRDDASCCSARCALEPQPDAGVVFDDAGTQLDAGPPRPARGSCE